MSALVPVEQKQVVFYDDELTAVQADDGRIYVAVTQMCNVLGLDPRNQRRRIQDHTILSEGYTRGVIYAPPSADGRGGEQEAGRYRNNGMWGEWRQLTQPEMQTICRYMAYCAWQFRGGSHECLSAC